MIIFQLIYAYIAILVEVKVKVKFNLEQATKAQRGRRGIALFFPYLRERPGSHLQEAGWAPGPVWTGAEILAPTGNRSPDRPARS